MDVVVDRKNLWAIRRSSVKEGLLGAKALQGNTSLMAPRDGNSGIAPATPH